MMRALTVVVTLALLMPACGEPAVEKPPVPTFDPALATLDEIQERLADGRLTSEKLVRGCLARIEAYEEKGPALNALITVNEEALEQARALDAEWKESGPRGPLHGIPIILKDNYDTADLPTTGGSAILASSRPPDDAAVVTKLREAGLVVIGKANMSEFALSYGWLGYGSAVGQTRNPHNPLRDPSGSSSGSAVSVAAGFTVLATGTDTAGSIRGPACVCGVVGIKPTLGLVSRDGIIPASLTFDVAGPIARSVRGAAFLLQAMAGPDETDPMTRLSRGRTFDFATALDAGSLKGARLGVVRSWSGANADADEVFEAALATLKKRGAVLVDVKLPEPLTSLWPMMGPVVDADFGPQITDYLATLPEGAPRTVEDLIARAESPEIAASGTPLNPARIQGFRDCIASGGTESAGRKKSVGELMPSVRGQIVEIMTNADVRALVFLTMPCPASVRHDAKDPAYECTIDDPYRPCYLASTTGFPEITVPAGLTKKDEMPIGLSFFGRPFAEETLIGLAFAYEQAARARRVPKHTPPLPAVEN